MFNSDLDQADCADAIFALQQLGERAVEFDEDLMLAFIEQKKAFDCVNREELWAVLEDYGVHAELLDGIRALYKDSEAMIRTDGGNTNWFDVTSGVRQGCVLSPLLLIVYMDRVTREANGDETKLIDSLFADEMSLMHKEESELQEHVAALDEAVENYGMRISMEKTRVMNIGRDSKELKTEIKGKQLTQVKEFK